MLFDIFFWCTILFAGIFFVVGTALYLLPRETVPDYDLRVISASRTVAKARPRVVSEIVAFLVAMGLSLVLVAFGYAFSGLQGIFPLPTLACLILGLSVLIQDVGAPVGSVVRYTIFGYRVPAYFVSISDSAPKPFFVRAEVHIPETVYVALDCRRLLASEEANSISSSAVFEGRLSVCSIDFTSIEVSAVQISRAWESAVNNFLNYLCIDLRASSGKALVEQLSDISLKLGDEKWAICEARLRYYFMLELYHADLLDQGELKYNIAAEYLEFKINQYDAMLASKYGCKTAVKNIYITIL